MKTLEVRRHAKRDSRADRLSPEGRAQAEDLGRSLSRRFDVVFTSPAERAAETAAWILRGMHAALPPDHAVIPGLAGKGTDSSPAELAGVLTALLDRVPDGGHGLAIGHTPIAEAAVEGLTGRRVQPLGECEGVLISVDDDGAIRARELRLGRP